MTDLSKDLMITNITRTVPDIAQNLLPLILGQIQWQNTQKRVLVRSNYKYHCLHPFLNYLRIGKVSKDVFDNDDFHKANQSVTDEELRMPRKGKNWNNIWKSATDPNYVEKGTDVNAFRYSSAWSYSICIFSSTKYLYLVVSCIFSKWMEISYDKGNKDKT